ncbi:DNA/RNA polymerases superfamily protein [Gossypium australe]|uniref:DNA/RNA polymerases superfamily protein n=1 Tax=Gossypium australe TaxID=47621 RepID=A0A5B6UW44_9ROSI|nr:DNA/RNA polymerases superfamily protein [Gossypium australe]
MLKCCEINFRVNWEKYLPLVKFTYNNNYHASLGMSPFEELYGRKCRSSICWMELSERKLVNTVLVCKIKKSNGHQESLEVGPRLPEGIREQKGYVSSTNRLSPDQNSVHARPYTIKRTQKTWYIHGLSTLSLLHKLCIQMGVRRYRRYIVHYDKEDTR